MSAELRPDGGPSSVYRQGIGHVYASGGHSNIDISASNGWTGWKGRKVEISRTCRSGQTGKYETAQAMVNPEAAALLAAVLGDIDDWAELTALRKLLREAAAYEGGGLAGPCRRVRPRPRSPRTRGSQPEGGISVTVTKTRLTPIRIVEQATNLRTGRAEIWEAVSEDGVWAYKREEGPGTPWVVIHVPTDRWTFYSSLLKARRATADGSALSYLDAEEA